MVGDIVAALFVFFYVIPFLLWLIVVTIEWAVLHPYKVAGAVLVILLAMSIL